MRYYYGLDSLRAIMMIFGIFIHATLFVNYSDWSYKSMHGTSAIISVFSQYISLFRMECFFILCGFLACMLLTYKDKNYFLNNRRLRVLVPLISSFLFFIFIPKLFMDNKLTYELQHLWFLLTLLALSMASCFQPVLVFMNKSTFNLKICFVIALVFFLWAVFSFALTKIKLTGFVFYFLDAVILKSMYYSIFYFIGFMLFNEVNLNKVKDKIHYILFFGFVFSITSSYFYYKKYILKNISLIEQIIKTSSDFLSGLSIGLLLFVVFLRLDYNNRFLNFLKDSSLIIYVSHYGVIHILAPHVDKISNGVYSFYIYLCLATIMCCIMIYHIMNSFNITRVLFGIRSGNNSKVKP